MSFEAWLEASRIDRARLGDEQVAVLRAAFQFLKRCGRDYASRRLVEHFLLNSGLGLKVAQVARLAGAGKSNADVRALLDLADQTLKGHTDPVRPVAFSPNGMLLVSGSSHGSVRLWRGR